MTMPNFILLGAGKAGTSSLYHYLGQHPEVYTSPVKETNFFALEGTRPAFASPDAGINRWSVTELAAYTALFDGAGDARAIGEASPLYLYDELAPANIRRHVPDAKLLVMLRDPADRAYSTYLYLRKNGRETLATFREALDAEPARIRAGWEWTWHYRALGFYARQLQRYLDLFPRDQLRIHLYQDFKRDPGRVLRDIYRFLGVDPAFAPDMSVRRNVSGVPRSALVHRLLRSKNPIKRLGRALVPPDARERTRIRLEAFNLKRPPFPPQDRVELVSGYREDIVALSAMIDRDLSAWLEPVSP